MRAVTSLLACCVLASAGCVWTPYQKIDGKWHHVTFDTGVGRSEKDLHADTDTFSVFPGHEYAKDAHTVFFRGRAIEGADPATFELLPSPASPLIRYAKDKDHVFLGLFRIRGADPKTFEVVDGPYSRDTERFYCGSLPMHVAHPNEFEVVHWSGMVETGNTQVSQAFGPEFEGFEGHCTFAQGWSRDGEFYYYGPARMTDRDYTTFEVINYRHARDKNGRFCGDRRFRRTTEDPDET